MDAEDRLLSERVRRIAAELLRTGRADDEPEAILAALRLIAAADRLPRHAAGPEDAAE